MRPRQGWEVEKENARRRRYKTPGGVLDPSRIVSLVDQVRGLSRLHEIPVALARECFLIPTGSSAQAISQARAHRARGVEGGKQRAGCGSRKDPARECGTLLSAKGA